MARENAVAKKVVLMDTEGKLPVGVRVTFSNGKAVEVVFEDLSPEMLTRLAAHGLSQKLGDSFAGAKGDAGLAHAQCQIVADALHAGDWTTRGEGDGGDFVIAMANLTKVDADAVRAKLKTLDEDAIKALKARKDVKAEMARLKAERLAEKAGEEEVDLGSLFDE